MFDARSKTYFPSSRLAPFCAWIAASYGMVGRTQELLRDVHARTGMVVTASTPHDLFMQVIDLASPEGQAPERGLQISMFGSAIGSAYLSMLDEADIRRLADRARVARADIPTVLEAVERVRTIGYAHGERIGDRIWSLAMPLPGLAVPTVLGLAGPSDDVRPSLDMLHDAMRDAIARWHELASSGQ